MSGYFTHKHTGDTVIEIGQAMDVTPGRKATPQVIFMRADDDFRRLLTIDADAFCTLYSPQVPA